MKHKSINGTKRKGLLSLISALLALLTLSSCASTYTAKIKGGDGSGEWLPPVSGDWGDLGNGSGKGDYSDLFGDLGDFDPSHLFSKNGFDPSSLAGLAGLAGMGDLAEKMKDFSGFTQGDAYFIADFDANPSKYSGAGRFLFAKNKVFSKEEREELMKELSGEDVILASYKADEEGLPVEEYAVYPADENLSQIYISRKNPETGEEELLLYDYVSTPVNGELPVLPGEQIPDLSGLEQGDRYSTGWLEWLIYEDQGRIYPMLENGVLYTSRYDNNPQYTPSPWSIRTEGIIARLALSLGLDGQEFAYADETGERYVWKVFYRDDKGDFSAAESSHPWKIKQLKSGYYRMELDLFNYGLNMMLKDDGSNNSYETVFIIEDTEGRILCWYCNDVAWTDSSEAYYAQAVETGIQEDHRGQVPVIPGKEPQNPFSSEWLSWLIDEDKGNTYPKTDLEPSTGTFSPTLAPSAFLIWPYDGVTGSVYKTSRFGLALTVDHNKVDYTDGVGKKTHPRYVWTYGYREVGQENFLFAAYPQDNCTPYGYALYGDTCIYYLDLLNYGMRPALKEGGQPTSYELVFVIRDRENNSEVVGWQSTVVEWNASAQAYYEKAVELDIQDDVLNKAPVTTKEPADKQSNDWVEWLLETDGSDYPQFESIKLGSHVYKTGMSASPFYAQNKLFCLGVDSLQAQTMKMTKYRIFYREKGSSNAYWLLETTLKNKTSKTLNSEGLTEYSFDMVIRDPEMIVAEEAEYEAVFVSLDINQNVLGWGEVDFSYNASSEGFRKEVLAVQPEPVEPANKKTQAWVNWLLAEKDNGYPQLKTLTFGEKRYAPEMEPSPFYVNGEDFCMEVYVESELIPIRECMIFYKKRGELYYKVHDTLYVRNLKNSTLSDPNLRGSRFDLIVYPDSSPFVQAQASYDVVLVCCDSGGNVSAWGTGSFEYNDSSECFRKDIGTDDEPADQLSNEWVKWLQKYGKEVYPQFAALSFLPSDGAPFTRLDSRYRMNFSVSFAKNPFDMRSYRVFYRIKGETQYKVFSAPVITASDMGGVWTKKVALEIDPTAGYFTSNGQDPREYEVLLVALDQQGVIKSFGTGSFIFDKEAEELRKNAALVYGEPTDHTSIAWVNWLLAEKDNGYPQLKTLTFGKRRYSLTMEPSPFYIKNNKFYMELYVESELIPFEKCMIFCKKKDESSYKFEGTHYVRNLRISSLEDNLRGAWFDLEIDTKTSFLVQQQASYDVVVVCCDLVGNVSGWGTGSFEYNDSSEAFYRLYRGEKTDEPADRYSNEWAKWLKTSDKPQFGFASFEMITDPPFRIRNGYYCMSVYLQTQNSTGNMTSFRVFYRESGTNDAYRCFDAPIYKTEGELRALRVDLSLDPRESYFSTGSAGGRKYDVLLVALNAIGDVSSWVEGSFTYTDAAEAVRQKALAQGLPVPLEPSVKNSDEWVEWMLAYGEKAYPRFESLSMSEHRFEEGMAPSPFYIREDLTSKTYVLEFKATVNPALSPFTAVRLCYKKKGGEDGFLFIDSSLVEAVPLSSKEVLYRVALNPKRYYFRMQNGEPAQYELLLMGLYGNTVVQWQSTELVWNQSAESFRALAVSTGAYYGAVENTGMKPTRYSLYWSEWLKANYESIKVEKFTAKPWGGLTHGGGEKSSSICIYEGTLCLGVKYELGRDLSAGLSSGEHPYKWRLYYRAKGSVGKYTLTMLEPLAMGSTKEMLFFDLGGCDPAFRFPEGTEIDGYEMILVVSKATDDLPLYFSTFNVSWNDSSVSFYKDALQYGYVQEKEE